MVFLPLYLPNSSLTRRPRLGLAALALWVAAQAAWLQQGYELEFMGRSTFAPGLWWASLAFFLVNCWILGLIISDLGTGTSSTTATSTSGAKEVIVPPPSSLKSPSKEASGDWGFDWGDQADQDDMTWLTG